MRLSKELTREYNKQYREVNKEKIKELAKKYRKDRREELQNYANLYSKSPKGRFVQQKVQAKRRGIPWELTFEEWWGIWDASGKWELRGFGAGKFCMSRYKDEGAYTKGNVIIASTEDNKGRRV